MFLRFKLADRIQERIDKERKLKKEIDELKEKLTERTQTEPLQRTKDTGTQTDPIVETKKPAKPKQIDPIIKFFTSLRKKCIELHPTLLEGEEGVEELYQKELYHLFTVTKRKEFRACMLRIKDLFISSNPPNEEAIQVKAAIERLLNLPDLKVNHPDLLDEDETPPPLTSLSPTTVYYHENTGEFRGFELFVSKSGRMESVEVIEDVSIYLKVKPFVYNEKVYDEELFYVIKFKPDDEEVLTEDESEELNRKWNEWKNLLDNSSGKSFIIKGKWSGEIIDDDSCLPFTEIEDISLIQ